MKTKTSGFTSLKKYIRLDGWRGYMQPVYAVAGANDTGMANDSPCPSNVCHNELKGVRSMLRKNGIKTRELVCESSNIFCIHRYVITKIEDFARAKTLMGEYFAKVKASTSLLYETN